MYFYCDLLEENPKIGKGETNMANHNQKGGVNPVIAAITGAVVGAGVIVAGVVALKDKKTAQSLKKHLLIKKKFTPKAK